MQKKLGEDVQQHTRAHGYAAQRRINGNKQQFLLEDGGPDATEVIYILQCLTLSNH